MNYLLVCTGNTCRSPMAHAMLLSLAEKDDAVASAGIAAFPGMPMSRQAAEALRELGIDFEKRSERLSDGLVAAADLILCMERAQKDDVVKNFPGAVGKTATLAEWAGVRGGDVADPYGGDMDEYRSVRDRIRELLMTALKKG